MAMLSQFALMFRDFLMMPKHLKILILWKILGASSMQKFMSFILGNVLLFIPTHAHIHHVLFIHSLSSVCYM